MNADFGVLVLRIVMGGTMFFAHGFPKMQHYQDMVSKFGGPFGMGPELSLVLVIFAEGICSLLVVMGLFTRLACIPLIITMSVAFFWAHAADPFRVKELPFLFGLSFVAILIMGSGRYSLQNFFKISSQSRIPLMGWLLK